MVVFSEEFGSEDPFADAVQAAAAMSRHDVLAYQPHVGIASGPVIVGYAGTAFRYNVSVFGAPVALAARCAAVKSADPDVHVSSTIVMPAADWGDRDLDRVVPPDKDFRRFELRDARDVEMKGLGSVSVREIHNTGSWMSMASTEDHATEGLRALQDGNRYWPRGSKGAPR